MIPFFADPYKEETLASAIARHIWYTGNNIKKGLLQLFGTPKHIKIEFPDNLAFLAQQFSKESDYTPDYFIRNHTLLPIFLPFKARQQQEIAYRLLYSKSKVDIYGVLGLHAKTIKLKRTLQYCPKCVSQDIENFGEPFFHRIHQMQAVVVCPEHGCYLNDYPSYKTGFIPVRLDAEQLDLQCIYESDKEALGQLQKISNSLLYVLQNQLTTTAEELNQKYISFLFDMGFISRSGRLSRKQLKYELEEFYGEAVWRTLSNYFEVDFGWLRCISKKYIGSIHPVRHILLINFLTTDIEGFFKLEEKKVSFQGCRSYENFHNKVDWKKRDQEYVQLVRSSVEKILQFENAKRITLKQLNEINDNKFTYSALQKLPETNKLINEVIESHEQFQIRKSNSLL